MSDKDGVPTIVVGADGSTHSRRAVRWAVDEARQRQARIILVHAFNYGPAAATPYPGDALEQIAEDAEAILRREVEHAALSGVYVEGRLECGSAAHALIEASRQADLVVVGSRGHGAITGALLGSVSSAVVRHAHCPVVVVPAPDREGEVDERPVSAAAGRPASA